MDSTVFLDTGFAIALLAPRDQYHEIALRVATKIKQQRTKVITSNAVLLEIGAALSKYSYRAAAVRFIDALRADSNVEIVWLDDRLFNQAYQLFCERPDKEWSLTDCASFIIMKEQCIFQALATDDHFAQSGFLPLLIKD
ncbi:MAG TPA: PIN domain-containing protein [Gammaproteobacteria bacterium]|nr:PIN domain-containing protein [Gammaproteobacteria bacterium]